MGDNDLKQRIIIHDSRLQLRSGRIPLVTITGTAILVLYLLQVKSRQLISISGTYRWAIDKWIPETWPQNRVPRWKFHQQLRWRHNELDGVSDHQPHDCLLNLLFRRKSKKTSKLRVTGLCAGNSPWTGEFPAQKASNAENVSIWWRHHDNDCRIRTPSLRATRGGAWSLR